MLGLAVVVLWRRPGLAPLRAFQNLLCVLTAVLAAHYLLRWGVGHAAHSVTPTSAMPRPVVVVLVFDELDSQMLAARATSFPAFHLLRRKAGFRGEVYPPANYTHISVPAMLTGQPLVGADVSGDSLVMTTADGRRSILGRDNDVFRDSLSNGLSVSIVGWHLPYCAIWSAVHRCLDDAAMGVPSAEVDVVSWMLARSSLLWHWRSGHSQGAIEDIDRHAVSFFTDRRNLKAQRFPQLFKRLAERTLTDAASGRYDLVYAHLPCPHLPRLDGAMSQGMLADYYANLVACDRLLSDLLQQAGASVQRPLRLLVTSDHWFRGLDWIAHRQSSRVPDAPRQVPIFILSEMAAPGQMLISGGSNIGLRDAVRHLLEAPAVDASALQRAFGAYGPAQTRLDRF